jgi:hypothetical protein
VMFLDIRNFTANARSRPPGDIAIYGQDSNYTMRLFANFRV